MENYQTKELTLGEVVKQIFKHKIKVLAITLVIVILGTLFFGIIPNRKDKEWVSTFQLTLSANGSFELPKNQNRNYKDIVSLDNLTQVKSNNDAYKNINVKEMVEKNQLSIDRSIESLDDKSIYIEKYTIRINSRYFDDFEVAKKFINDIVINAFDTTSLLEKEKQTYVSNYQSLMTYESKLSLFNNRLKEIKDSYNAVINAYGNVEVNDKLLSAHIQDVDNFLAGLELIELQNELKFNAYSQVGSKLVTYHENSKSSYQNTKESNKKVIDLLKQELAEIAKESSGESVETIVNKITQLIVDNENIDKEIELLDKRIKFAKGETTDAEKQALALFDEKIESFNQKVVEFNNRYLDNVASFQKERILIEYTDSVILSETGGRNTIVVAGASAVIGIVAGCIVAVVIEFIKRQKEEEAKEQQA